MIHKQYNLPTFIEAERSKPVVPDFELKNFSVLKTAKDLIIKTVFEVHDDEVKQLKGQRFGRTMFSGANYTMATTDYLLGITSLAIAPNIGLPHPSLVGTGKTFIVKDEAGGATTTTITVASDGERLIDGASTSTLTANYQVKKFYTDGANYFTC